MITDNTTTTKSYATIKLGIDAHAKWYYVARQLDGATPQRVQKMDLHGLLHFVAKQQRLAHRSSLSPHASQASPRHLDKPVFGSILHCYDA